jgi:hypothetical protein
LGFGSASASGTAPVFEIVSSSHVVRGEWHYLKGFYVKNWERLLQLPNLLSLFTQIAYGNARQLKQPIPVA